MDNSTQWQKCVEKLLEICKLFKKFNLIVLVLVFTAVAPLTQAATRTDAPLDMVTVENPISEKACLEAFVNSNFSQAFNLCLPLAQAGLRDAQLVTGLMYALGEGIDKNSDMAKLWLNEASRNGSEEAKEVLVDFKLSD